MKDLSGKVAIITGSSRGIGADIAKTLAQRGAKVIVNYANNKEEANKVVTAIKEIGGEAIALQGDVSSSKDANTLFKETIVTFGKVDILVNNAGVTTYKTIENFSDEELDRVLDINVKGTFYMLREASKHLEEGGSIVNFSSTVTRVMIPTYSVYAASKAAVDQFTRVFSKEIGHKNINVNAIVPGPVDTELFREGKSEETIASMAAMSAFNRIGATEDIAKVVAFLVSDDAKWITGQSIGANGGLA